MRTPTLCDYFGFFYFKKLTIMEFVFWNGIKIFGYDYKRMIAYLKTLEKEYLDNLVECIAEEGRCDFLWESERKKHIVSDGIDIPDGDYWSIQNDFNEFIN
jgi:hypothetical protein